MITVKQAAYNIHNVAKQANYHNWDQGSKWYIQAFDYCGKLAYEFDCPISTVVGILAVLSPQCAWDTNKLATRDILSTGTTARNVFPANVNKALRIIQGETFEQVAEHKRYSRKVRAFYDNILNYSFSDAVTIDTHAARAAFDNADLSRKQIRWVFETKQGNTTLQDAYRVVSKYYGVPPHVLQAVVWLRVKDSLTEDNNG